MKKLYQLLLDRWNQKTDTVLVTIVEGNGSVPRTTGAYMVVAKNGRIYGTIGGGNLEYQAVKKAMELAGTAAHYVENFDLGTGENSELGMVCGGRVKVLFYSACAQDPGVGEFLKEALAAADVEDIEAIVRPCGLGKSKARDISACMKMLRDEYDGKVPDDFNALLKLPGVGRKSANLIMGDVFGKPAIVTDTHCIRLTNRMGLVDGIKEPKKVEMELWKLVPPEEGSDFCHRLVMHGREICTARTKPYCDRCCLNDICKKMGVE